MINYDTSYLNRVIVTNNIKDKLTRPMVNLIKSNIEKIQYVTQMQEKYR